MPELDANNLPDDVASLKALLMASQRELKTTREQSVELLAYSGEREH